MLAAIDCGSSLVKAVWNRKYSYVDNYIFKSTAETSLDKLFEEMKIHGVDTIYTAGIGSITFPEGFKIDKCNGDAIENEIKLQATGAHKLLEINGTPLEKYLLISIGTGASYTSIENTDVQRFPYGSPLAGGFISGMCKLLNINIQEFDNLARKGKSLDLLVKDNIPEMENTFFGNCPIAFFGKASTSSSKEDICASLISMVAASTVRSILLIDQASNFPHNKNVVYIGTPVSKMSCLKEQLDKWTSAIGKKAYFPNNGEYSLAIGTYMYSESNYGK